MKSLVDENAPRTIVEVLRNCGYDLLWIREYRRGMADEEIVRLSISENRIILTFDKDFGELIFHKTLRRWCTQVKDEYPGSYSIKDSKQSNLKRENLGIFEEV